MSLWATARVIGRGPTRGRPQGGRGASGRNGSRLPAEVELFALAVAREASHLGVQSAGLSNLAWARATMDLTRREPTRQSRKKSSHSSNNNNHNNHNHNNNNLFGA